MGDSLDITRFAGHLGATVHGLDLAAGLGESQVTRLQAALADHGVLVLPDQHLDAEQHRAAALAFGAIRTPPDYLPSLAGDGRPEIGVIETTNVIGTQAATWHADVTWLASSPRYSILNMRATPPAGGDTMWASQIAAHDRLSDAMRAFVTPLVAEHGLGDDPDRSARHPVVHRHPISDRRALSVNPTFTRRIVGLSDRESDAILELLYDEILQPESVCRWRWSAGDLAIWDNHFVLHYAIADYGDEYRRIERIEIEGEPLLPC